MATDMSPVILSLPVMKAEVGSSSPRVIAARSSVETMMVQSAGALSLVTVAPSMCRKPSPFRSTVTVLPTRGWAVTAACKRWVISSRLAMASLSAVPG